MLQTMEPVRTIYTEDWVRGRSEVHRMIEGAHPNPFGRALGELEDAWEHVRPLSILCEDRERGTDVSVPEIAVLTFVEVEVVDLFRWLAGETLLCIPNVQKKRVRASVDDLECELDDFLRNVTLSLLACRTKLVPADVRALVSANARPLVKWAQKYGETIGAIRRYLDRRGYGETDD